jgi:hypothetical protein
LDDEDREITIGYTIKNFGRTPATLHEVSAQYGELTDRPVYKTKIQMLAVIPQGEIIRMPDQTYPDGLGGTLFFGYLVYTDIFGYRHTTGFGLQHVSGDVVLVGGGPEYNYSRVERAESTKAKG